MYIVQYTLSTMSIQVHKPGNCSGTNPSAVLQFDRISASSMKASNEAVNTQFDKIMNDDNLPMSEKVLQARAITFPINSAIRNAYKDITGTDLILECSSELKKLTDKYTIEINNITTNNKYNTDKLAEIIKNIGTYTNKIQEQEENIRRFNDDMKLRIENGISAISNINNSVEGSKTTLINEYIATLKGISDDYIRRSNHLSESLRTTGIRFTSLQEVAATTIRQYNSRIKTDTNIWINGINNIYSNNYKNLYNVVSNDNSTINKTHDDIIHSYRIDNHKTQFTADILSSFSYVNRILLILYYIIYVGLVYFVFVKIESWSIPLKAAILSVISVYPFWIPQVELVLYDFARYIQALIYSTAFSIRKV